MTLYSSKPPWQKLTRRWPSSSPSPLMASTYSCATRLYARSTSLASTPGRKGSFASRWEGLDTWESNVPGGACTVWRHTMSFDWALTFTVSLFVVLSKYLVNNLHHKGPSNVWHWKVTHSHTNSAGNLPVCSLCPSLWPSCLFTNSHTASLKPKDLLAFSHVPLFFRCL